MTPRIGLVRGFTAPRHGLSGLPSTPAQMQMLRTVSDFLFVNGRLERQADAFMAVLSKGAFANVEGAHRLSGRTGTLLELLGEMDGKTFVTRSESEVKVAQRFARGDYALTFPVRLGGLVVEEGRDLVRGGAVSGAPQEVFNYASLLRSLGTSD